MTILKIKNWQVPYFYICTLLFYPLVWVRLFRGRLLHWSELQLFTPGLIALLCCSLLLLDPKALFSFFFHRAARFVGIAFGIILLVSLIQLIVCYDGQITYLWSSLYWIAIPLFCAVNRREIEKYLPFFMIFLGLATIIQSLQAITLSAQCYGIAGNRNWNATLIAATLPFICFGIHKYLGKHYKISLCVILFSIIGACGVIWRCESKAAILALGIACCSVLLLCYWKKLALTYWFRGGVLLIVIFIILLLLFKERVFVILQDDQRLWLWSGAFSLIKENVWFGCGEKLFESAYTLHIPAEYYLGRFTSIRHTHAHNHLLHFAATMGIPALFAWCSVIFYAMVKNLRRAQGFDNWNLKLYLFVFILLAAYSMLDIAILSWPLGCLGLIFLGILIGRAVEETGVLKFPQNKLLLMLSIIIGLCAMVFLFNYLYLNLQSSLHYRNAKLLMGQKNKKSAFVEIEKSIANKKTPENIYIAATIALYDFKNPKLCLKFLNQLDSLGVKNYEHNNQLRARALYVMGRIPESLVYFGREQEVFPLSCVNLYYCRLVLTKLGKKKQADVVDRELKRVLKMKSFTESMLPALLKNPYNDLRFRIFNDSRTK